MLTRDDSSLVRGDRAVSPVIGVILMVAITVILGAIIGSFALSFGDDQEPAPSTVFGFEFDGSGGVVITHDGGQKLDGATLDVDCGSGTYSEPFSREVTAGDQAKCTGVSEGDTINVIWSSESGTSGQILTSRTAASGGSGGPTAPSNGLVLHYKLDGDATDASGSNDGTVHGATFINDAERGQVASFDGSDDYIISSSSVSMSNFSTAFWVKTTDTTKWTGFVSTLDDDDDFWQVVLNDSGAVKTEFSTLDSLTGSTPVNDGNWHHVVVTWNNDANAMEMYVDGSAESVSGSGTPDTTFTKEIMLGTNRDEADYLNGDMDDVRVYDRVLSATEANDLYEATK